MRWRVVVVVVPVLLEIQTEVEERALEDFLCHEQEGDQQPAAAIARREGGKYSWWRTCSTDAEALAAARDQG